jgi:hypothetical protein
MAGKINLREILICAICIPLLMKGQTPTKEALLTNSDVVTMFQSGLSPGIVKASIGRSKTNFDLGPNSLIQLKKSGLPDDILLAMLSKNPPNAPAPLKDSLFSLAPGIYYKSAGNYKTMEPGVLTCEAAKGLRKTLSGFINSTIRSSIAGQHGQISVEDSKPVYLFILDFPARNPEEFILARLIPAAGSRQITFQKPANASGSILLNDSLKIDFISKKISAGIYEVTPIHPLQPGEYGFLYSASSLYQGTRFKVFDFTVQPKP